MTFRFFPLLVGALLFFNVQAQTKSDDVLFTIDGEPVYTSEFIRVYNKNLDLVKDESQKNVDEYLTLFTNYKLKIKQANALGLQNKPAYQRELQSYKKQLAQNFLTDTTLTEALVKEAYNRMLYEVKASHILVRLPENASPQDTLVAYNHIMELRDRAEEEGFDKVRKEVHNGKTIFGEDLGYFSAFRMVYPFETAAYNTPVGTISMPFRTRFGYHIVKVYDKRKSRGEVTVAHIMITNKPDDSINNTSEKRIQEIYKKIKQGEDFAALAQQFSEDPSSAKKGGMLQPFSGGQLSSETFENAAFSLKNIGDISEPIKTRFGWHIIKLYNKRPVQPFQDMKPELEMKVKRDDRSHLIDEALFDNLKNKYQVVEPSGALTYFKTILNDTYYKHTWQLPVDFDGDTPLVSIGDDQLTYQDFGDYLLKTQKISQSPMPLDALVSSKFHDFLSKRLVQYQEDHLEAENKDFANIMTEYREGLLMFDLMESTIWNASKTDSTEIKNYYDTHKRDYVWPDRIDAVVASSSNDKILKKVGKLLKQHTDIEAIKADVNTSDRVNVIFTTAVMDAENPALPPVFEFKKGLSKIYKHHDGFVIVYVNELFPSGLKSFDEAKGAVINDYQNYKEAQWMQDLRKTYKVVVNPQALEKAKAIINNQ